MPWLDSWLGYSAGEFQVLDWLSLRGLGPWIKHLPPVCWSTFLKSNFKWSWVCKSDIMENKFFIVTRGQFWTLGIVIAWTCLYVRVSVNHEFFATITCHPFKLESPNLTQECKTPCNWCDYYVVYIFKFIKYPIWRSLPLSNFIKGFFLVRIHEYFVWLQTFWHLYRVHSTSSIF